MDKIKENVNHKAFSIGKMILDKYSSVIVLLVMIILASLISDAFFTASNILNVLRQVAANGILSIGLLMVIITGGIAVSYTHLRAHETS